MRVMGIDPGVTGGWAYIGDGEVVLDDLPVAVVGPHKQILPAALAEVLRLYSPEVVVLENNAAMGSNGVQANFSMGQSMGLIVGVCAALSYPLVRMKPGEWKPLVGLSGVKGTDAQKKEASRQRALELLPNHPQLQRKKDHNRADAYLIGQAHLWRRK